MRKDRYQHLCLETEAGNDSFVRHPATNEEGRVTECVMSTGHMVVQTNDNHTRCWDYHDCEDLDHPKSGPMVT
ncbi:MAG: hypothetical protein C0616_06565 [Desulfuromonas sp.]|nr:MAG: hypothetical protein C0616_06565 [Desulfuromonas sp.]